MSLYDKLSNFPTTTKAGATTDSNGGAAYVTYKQITGLPVGVLISSVTFDVYSTPTDTSFKGGVYTDSGNNPTTLLASGELTNQNISNTYTTLSIPLTSNATVPSNGIVWVAIIPNKTNPLLRVSTSSPSYTNSKFSTTTGSYTNYSNWMLSTASVQGSGENNVRFGVVYTTSVAKQRFVENFSGSVLDIDRWKFITQHSSTAVMSDSIDGGLIVSTTAGANYNGAISFNTTNTWDSLNIRNFAHNSSVYIDVFKQNGASTAHKVIVHGMGEKIRGDGAGNNASLWGSGSNMNTSYFMSRTCASNGSQTDTASDVAYDQNWHNYKIENKSASVEYTLDGVLKTTITTNLPASRMAPLNGVQANGSVSSYSIRYVECYNT